MGKLNEELKAKIAFDIKFTLDKEGNSIRVITAEYEGVKAYHISYAPPADQQNSLGIEEVVKNILTHVIQRKLNEQKSKHSTEEQHSV